MSEPEPTSTSSPSFQTFHPQSQPQSQYQSQLQAQWLSPSQIEERHKKRLLCGICVALLVVVLVGLGALIAYLVVMSRIRFD